jgi:thiol:disulfide interchange protein DsbA
MSDPHKVQVLFFFSYGCHGCEMFHTPFDQWAVKQRKAPKNKAAIYVYPVSFNAHWAMLAKLYYVMENLDPAGKLNGAIFTAVLKNGIKLWDPEVMKKFFIQNGYTAKQFDQAYNAFNVNRQVKRADDISKAYSIIATPDIIINGPVHSYKLDLVKAGNNIQRLLDIVNYLVARESKLL